MPWLPTPIPHPPSLGLLTALDDRLRVIGTMDDESTVDLASEHGVDATLGGYVATHGRPPAFEGADGSPYTVSVETERTPDLSSPVAGYLVFPRWADNGMGVVGHAETPLLWWGATRDEVRTQANAMTLMQVKRILDGLLAAPATADGEEE